MYNLESEGFKKHEYEFLKLYYEMQNAHADEMNGVTLKDETKARYAEKLEQETLRAYVIDLMRESRTYVQTMQTNQAALSKVLNIETKQLQRKIDSDLPN